VRRPRILLATPKPSVARRFHGRLERLGYRVAAAVHHGEDALAIARSLSPDLALVDEAIEAPDGITTSDTLLFNLSVPVVLMASRSPDRTAAREQAASSLGVVSRRCTDRMLCSAIELAMHRHGLQSVLDRSRSRFRTLFEASGTGAVVVETDGVVSDCNTAFASLLGYSSCAQVRGRRLEDFLYRPKQEQRRRLTVPVPAPRAGERPFRHQEGRPVWISEEVVPLVNPLTGREQRLHTFHDVTERRQVEILFHSLAFTDPLTGLPNRRFLEAAAPGVLEMLPQEGQRAALAFLDLVGFKEINDRLGHRAGDRVLREVGRRLEGVLRDNDQAARFGGDEFVVLLAGLVSRDEARIAAERVIARLAEPYEVDGRSVRILARAGVAIAPDQGTELTKLVDHADYAVTQAKASGGSVVIISEA